MKAKDLIKRVVDEANKHSGRVSDELRNELIAFLDTPSENEPGRIVFYKDGEPLEDESHMMLVAKKLDRMEWLRNLVDGGWLSQEQADELNAVPLDEPLPEDLTWPKADDSVPSEAELNREVQAMLDSGELQVPRAADGGPLGPVDKAVEVEGAEFVPDNRPLQVSVEGEPVKAVKRKRKATPAK